jgi:hypothetical protein
VLSVDETAYCQVQHSRALATGSTYIDSHVTVIRRRAVGGGFREVLSVFSRDAAPMDLDIRIEARSDFADPFEIKNRSVKKQGAISRHVGRHGELTLACEREMFRLKTCIVSSSPAEIDGTGLRFRVRAAGSLVEGDRGARIRPAKRDQSQPGRSAPAAASTVARSPRQGPRGRSVPVADLERQGT